MQMLWNGNLKCIYVSLRNHKGAFTEIRLFAVTEAAFFPVPNSRENRNSFVIVQYIIY